VEPLFPGKRLPSTEFFYESRKFVEAGGQFRKRKKKTYRKGKGGNFPLGGTRIGGGEKGSTRGDISLYQQEKKARTAGKKGRT